MTQVRQSPQTVQNVVTYDVVVGVDNTDLALKPGMTASTQIITDQRDDVFRVPDQALRYMPAGAPSGRVAAPAAGANGMSGCCATASRLRSPSCSASTTTASPRSSRAI